MPVLTSHLHVSMHWQVMAKAAAGAEANVMQMAATAQRFPYLPIAAPSASASRALTPHVHLPAGLPALASGTSGLAWALQLCSHAAFWAICAHHDCVCQLLQQGCPDCSIAQIDMEGCKYGMMATLSCAPTTIDISTCLPAKNNNARSHSARHCLIVVTPVRLM